MPSITYHSRPAAFSEWGSLCHSLYEDYSKGNLAEYKLGMAYDDRHPQYMKSDFPPVRGEPLSNKYYDQNAKSRPLLITRAKAGSH
jgi:hypothetical protein